MTRKLLLFGTQILIALSATASTYTITTNADSGPGSLRQGILDANSGACPAPCEIVYGSLPGVTTVELLTPLPEITAAQVKIHSEPPYRAWSLEVSGKNAPSAVDQRTSVPIRLRGNTRCSGVT